jgi:hypothetical protein
VTNSFERAVNAVLGIGIERLNEEWVKELKKEYWPVIEGKNYPSDIARPMVTHHGFEDLYNYAPAISPEGDKIVYFTDEVGEIQIRLISSLTGEDLGVLIKGGMAPKFESLHLMDGHTDFSPDGRKIAFFAMEKGKDILYILDIKEGKTPVRIELGVDQIRWPEFSSDGKKIAFMGLKNGSSDIYIYNIDNKSLKNITHDIYSDNYPTWKGDSVLFVSDRPQKDNWDYSTNILYISDLKGNIRKFLSFGKSIISPEVYNSDVYFISQRDGNKNLYVYKTDSGNVSQLTDIIGSFNDFSISNSGHMAFSVYSDLGWDIYFIDNIEDLSEKDPNPVKELDEEEYINVTLKEEDKLKSDGKAPMNFGVDYIAGALGYYSDFGLFGYFQLGMSDMLGNHKVYALFDNTGDLTQSSFYLQYFYLKHRLDMGASLIRQRDYFTFGQGYLAGDIWNLNTDVYFPIDKFKRLELGLSGYYLDGDLILPDPSSPTGWWLYPNGASLLPNVALMGNIALVLDNAVWSYINPIKGFRMRISFSRTLFSDENFWDLSTVYFDFRKYFYLNDDYSFAIRLFLMNNWGRESDLFGIAGIGGGRTVRGYDYNTQVGTAAGLLKLELRMPLIKRLDLGFPPISLGRIEGALFTDIGTATYDYKNLKFFTTEEHMIKLADPIMSYGVEFRLNLGITIFNFDISKRMHDDTHGTYYDIYFGLPF